MEIAETAGSRRSLDRPGVAKPAAVVFALLLLAGVPGARAQELEPRAYSASPVGANFIAVSVGGSSGAVLFDPSLPITDVEASIGVAGVGYAKAYGIWGRQGLLSVGIPYVVANFDGKVSEQARTVYRSGIGDLRMKASLNLAGAKAMSPREFAAAPRRTIVGISIAVQAPTGQYDATKLINIGTNRWAFKPELGVSVPVGRWSLEAYGGAWFFGSNDSFFPGQSKRRQEPLTSLQAHVSYTLKSRAWLAVDSTWYGGGASTVNENPPSSRFDNTRLGATVSLPVAARQSLKLSASKGTSVRTGNDFTSAVMTWQVVWFDRRYAAAP